MKKRAFFFIVAAGILWGTSGIFVKYLSPFGFTSLQLTFLRGLVSFLCVAGYALIFDRSLFCVRPRDLLLCVLVGAALFGTASLYYLSMQATTIATAVVLMYTAPIYVTVCSILLFGERFSPLKGVAIGLMLVGCVLVSGVIGDLKLTPVGIVFGILSGVCYGAYSIFSKVAIRRGSAPLQTTLYAFLFMTLIALPCCRVWEIPTCAAKNPALTLPLMLGIGVVTFVLPYVLYTLSLRDLPAGTASALSIVEPLAATLFGVILFREELAVLSLIGMVLILGAVALLGMAEGKKRKE